MPAGRRRRRSAAPRPEPFGKESTGDWIEASGRVQRLLADDRDVSPHLRFVVRTPAGQSLLISHNLEISERIPLGMGDRVAFRGLYEWNDLGGTVHWTHRDPRGADAGGWILFRNDHYR